MCAHVRIFAISCGAVCFGLKLGGLKLSVELCKPFDGLICRLTGYIIVIIKRRDLVVVGVGMGIGVAVGAGAGVGVEAGVGVGAGE